MLMQGQRVGLPVGGAVLSKNVGQLQGWPWAHFLERLAAGLGGWPSLSNGLMVPVIRNADQKGVLAIAKEMGDLAKLARDGKLKPGDAVLISDDALEGSDWLATSRVLAAALVDADRRGSRQS